MKYPKVNFIYASPLDDNRRKLYKIHNDKYPESSEVKKEVAEVKKLWDSINIDDRIMRAISDTLSISSSQDFDFYLFGAGLTGMSAPLMMPLFVEDMKINRLQIIDTIVHELIHKYISSSTTNTDNYWKLIDTKYPDKPRSTKSHLIIFATLEKVLPLIMSKDEINVCFDRFIGIEKAGYKISIEIVRKESADKIIQEFKDYTHLLYKEDKVLQ